MEPSEGDIDNIAAFTGLDPNRDRSLIVGALKAKNNNFEAVVNEFFDDAAKFRATYSWTEAHFTSDRDEGASIGIPSFQIHSEDQGVIQGVPENWHDSYGGPSRPPSRVNNRSPLSRAVDLTAGQVTGLSSRDQEEADMQRAIAESVAVSGRGTPQPPPQESGVASGDTSNPHFGPANRPDYDHNQWAMVTVAKEKVEPGPLGRSREPGAPAFLRCRKDYIKHRLGALLTIYHQIPAVRNMLLRLGTPAETYGQDAGWWAGQAIMPPPQPIADDAYWDAPADTDIIHETHRLMAFLDGTERAYGTADMLANILPSDWSPDPEMRFLDTIKELGFSDELPNPLIAGALMVSVDETDANAPQESSAFVYLRTEVQKEQWASLQTMYQLWDSVFHSNVEEESSMPTEQRQMALLTAIPDVLTVAVGNDGLPPGFEAPEAFWVDRYLPEHKVDVVNLQVQMAAVKAALSRVQTWEQQLLNWTPVDGGSPVDRKAMAQKVIDHDKQRLWQLQTSVQWRKHEEARQTEAEDNYMAETDVQVWDLTEDEAKLHKHYETHIAVLEQRLANIEAKLAELKTEKETCEKLFRTLQSRKTAPNEAEPDWKPVHRFTLRGMSAIPEVAFVCRRAEPDLMEMDESSAPVEEWWKLAYLPDSDEPLQVVRTTLAVAIEETCFEGAVPIFVYANEQALSVNPEPLSEALKTFVKFDNRVFRQELAQDSPREKKRVANGSPASPSKRLNRSTSLDSMASNRVSVGSDRVLGRDAPYGIVQDHFANADRDPFLVGEGSMSVEMKQLVDVGVPTVSGAAMGQQMATPPDSLVDADERVEYTGVDVGGEPSLGRQEMRLANVRLDGTQADGRAMQPLDQAYDQDQVPEAAPAATNGGNIAEAVPTQPEMSARGDALPFVIRAANGKVGGGGGHFSVMDMDMDVDSHSAKDEEAPPRQ